VLAGHADAFGSLGLDELGFHGHDVPCPVTEVDVGDGFQHGDHGALRGVGGDDVGLRLAFPWRAIG
jgi:hypothetical protein